MTFGYYPAGSVPVAALAPIASGAIIANNTSSTASPTAATGFYPESTVTSTGTITYTGAKTNILVNGTAATVQTLTAPITANLGAEINITNIAAFQTTITAPAGTTIDGASTVVLPAASTGIYPSVTLRMDSTTTFTIL